MFRALDPDVRVPWGIGMRPPSFVTARLMETWAHGLDVHAALGVEPRRHRPARARRVARDPRAPLRLHRRRTRAAGRAAAGRAHAAVGRGVDARARPTRPNRITGPAGEYCRVFVHRLTPADAPTLRAEGPAAADALAVARAFL